MPNPVEKIENVVTFGPQAPPAWGDDDYTQTFFFLVPATRREPFYIRVFDPDCGGTLDAKIGEFNTRTEFSLYGGPGTHSAPGATNPRPAPGFVPPGRLLKQQVFAVDPATDDQYWNIGPLNPLEGELVEQFKGYVYKVVVRGLSGNDGNLYRFFLSTSPAADVPVPGGNAFTYEYSFRIPAGPPSGRPVTVHLYPFADENVVSIKQSNFDLDNTATIKVFSVAKNGHEAAVSGDGTWASSVLPIAPSEHGLSLDLRPDQHLQDFQRRDLLRYRPVRQGVALLRRAHRWPPALQVRYRHAHPPVGRQATNQHVIPSLPRNDVLVC